jgi:hypothetical protein
MEKNIKDYLHLYLGCEVLFDNKKWILTRVGGNYCDLVRNRERCSVHPGDLKLLLRPLSDILNTEAFEVYKMYFNKDFVFDYSKDTGSANFIPARVRILAKDAIRIFEGRDYETGDFMKVVSMIPYLLSKHFDLFGLIDAGLAIDKTKIKML